MHNSSMMLRSLFGSALLLLCTSLAAAWTAGLIWFQGPVLLRTLALVAFLSFSVTVLIAFFTHRRRRAMALFLAVFAAALGWFFSLTPSHDRDWRPEVARLPVGVIEGDRLSLRNVRNFNWISETEADPERWENREYDLSRLESVDLFLSYWGRPEIAHTVISFGFGNNEFLAWSVEVRYRQGTGFDAIAGLFRTNEIILVAADERDVIRRRTQITREDVYLYRLGGGPPGSMRAFLTSYIEDANALAKAPAFYNSLTSNCTTVVLRLLRSIGIHLPLDWRLIANGFLPEFLYERGAVDRSLPFEQLRAASAISEKARLYRDDPEFSTKIRRSLPGMGGKS